VPTGFVSQSSRFSCDSWTSAYQVPTGFVNQLFIFVYQQEAKRGLQGASILVFSVSNVSPEVL